MEEIYASLGSLWILSLKEGGGIPQIHEYFLCQDL